MAPPGIAKSKIKSQPKERSDPSRNTTPVSVGSTARHTIERSASPYLQTSLDHPPPRAIKLSNNAITDVFDHASSIPSPSSLNSFYESIKGNIMSILKSREDACDQMMRELANRKKERTEQDRIKSLEMAKQQAEKARSQKVKNTRPPAVGAHTTTNQDGVEPSSAATSPTATNEDAKLVGTETGKEKIKEKTKEKEKEDSDSDDEPQQPAPAPSIPMYQIFGEDPSTFPDPTTYDIKEVDEDTPEDEKKKIFGVAHYPPSDLHDLTAGTAPDRDLSNAKPSNQVAAQTFLNFADPYLRPLTQEDLSFLTERGDRVSPFEIPKRGARNYKDIWAEEDGQFIFDAAVNLPANEGRGSIDQMGDEMLDSELVSVGPVTSRWLSLLYPVTRPVDSSQTANASSDAMDIDVEPSTQDKPDIPVASAFPESTWKNVSHTNGILDYQTLDSRLIEELRHIGFLGPAETPSYVDVQDDEVTARLRYLQRELRRVSLLNGARKARILEIANDRMAVQEWQGISDDLDTQLNHAYLKRTRNIGKGKKQVKRPVSGAAGAQAAGIARPGGSGLGEPIKSLMERRQQWNDLIGPVVQHGKISIPENSIFDKFNMDRLLKVEQENWIEDTEDA